MRRQQNKGKQMKEKGKTKKKRISSGSRLYGSTNAQLAPRASRKKTAPKNGTGLLAAGVVIAALLSGDDSALNEGPDDGSATNEHVVDCRGEWRDCDENCKKTYHVIQEAEHGGDECPNHEGDTDDCTGGECDRDR